MVVFFHPNTIEFGYFVHTYARSLIFERSPVSLIWEPLYLAMGLCSIESEILEGKYCILPLFPNTRDGFWLEINECDECLDWKHSPDDGNSCRRQLFIVPSGMSHNSLAGYYTPSRLIYNLLCTHTAAINCPLLYILILSLFFRKTAEFGQYRSC